MFDEALGKGLAEGPANVVFAGIAVEEECAGFWFV